MSRIYFDHAATSPLTLAALDAMREHLLLLVGNPSSVHLEGQRARAVVEEARHLVAHALAVEDDEVVFTGSGTEAANLALRGVAWAAEPGVRPHLVTSAIEHDAVRRTARWLAEKGHAELTVVPSGPDGVVDAQEVVAAIQPDTRLVSLMAVNNEIGTIQPIERVGRACRERGVAFHVDAVQALGRIAVRPHDVPADLVTLSAHKVGGPRGVGVLVVRRGQKLQPVTTGGAQESGLRAGTESAAGLAGAARAITDAVARTPVRAARIERLTRRLEAGLSSLPGVRVHGASAPRAPGLTGAAFDGADGEAVLQALDLAGFAVSTGSACTSGSTSPSHVLTALGLPPEVARATVRFSLDASNDDDEVDQLLAVLPAVVSACRAPVRR